MNILYVTPFPLLKSSSGVYTSDIAGYFSSHGHNVLVLNNDNAKTQYERNYKVITIPFGKPYMEFEFPCYTTHPSTTNKFYAMSDSDLKAYAEYMTKAYEKIIGAFKPDIIHSMYTWVNSAIIAGITDIPVITTAFGNEIHTAKEDLRYMEYLRDAVERSSYIIAPSKQIEQEMRNEFHLDSIKLKLIYRGFNDDIFRFIEDKQEMYRDYFGIGGQCPKIVLFHDTLSHIKGFDIFLKAARRLSTERDDICFIIIGKGEYQNQVKELCAEDSRHFIYYPEISVEEQPLIKHIVDIHVMPVRFEKFGISALESLAMGTPVLASDIGELSYFINDSNGMKIKDIDDNKLADAIEKMLIENFKEKASFFCHQYAQRNYSRSSGLKFIKKLYELASEEQ